MLSGRRNLPGFSAVLLPQPAALSVFSEGSRGADLLFFIAMLIAAAASADV